MQPKKDACYVRITLYSSVNFGSFVIFFQMEELQATVESKERIIKEQIQAHSELLREFENYKASYNKEGQEKLKHDLLVANNRIDELESALRKANKSK